MGKKKRIIFDVINSVKGGSGKSTFSLLLAAYFASKKDTAAYIIDLDLRGTSGENNYKHCLKGGGPKNGCSYKRPYV